MSIRELFVDTNDAKSTFHLVKQQECDKILTAIRETPDHAFIRTNTQNSQKYLGSVPNIVALSWAKEWGVRLYSREWLEKVRHRLKHDPDWKYLRVGG